MFKRGFATGKKPVRVAVTGAAGQIGYAMLFRIASGALLGADVPVQLQLLEVPQGMKALEGVVMELNDCAFPTLAGVTTSDEPERAFDGADFAFLVGAKPRSKGMERADLLQANASIFSVQGRALNAAANRDSLKVVVVGNPANTNALIASANAPDIDPRRFSAMTRLDHNRGLAQLSEKLGCGVTDISNFAIWGNHSATQYPDISHASLDGGSLVAKLDAAWVKDKFIPDVQQRGAAIIAARGASSAASAASSAIDHMRDWALGTNGHWTSMGVWTGTGSTPYGMDKDLYYSYPVVCENGDYKIVEGLPINDFSKDRMKITNDELVAERDACGDLAKRN